jgi:hypothetical protein
MQCAVIWGSFISLGSHEIVPKCVISRLCLKLCFMFKSLGYVMWLKFKAIHLEYC